MLNLNKKNYKQINYILLLATLILCGYGIMMIFSATLSFETLKYVKTQTIATVIGLIALTLFVLLDYRLLGKLYLPIYVVSNLLLLAVLFWGFGSKTWGADSWLRIGPIVFQPSEFVKIGLIISLAKFIDINKNNINEPFTLLKILAFAFLPVFLILLQPDVGTAIVFVFFIAVMLFIGGMKFEYFLYAVGIGFLSLPLLWLNLDTYQKNRIFDFLEPERDLSGSGYQAMQGKIAIGSGKFFGRGLFQGVYTQFNYVPEKQTDFIFSVLVEELGFVGGAALLFLYFVLLTQFVKIARQTKDMFASLMVSGFFAMFFFHIWENIGMTIGIMPMTGIPLPFMSYGGTFQLANLVCIGIVLSVGIHKEKISFKF